MGGAPVDRLVARRAVEALRAGVPSAAAVTALGTGQADLESRFRAALADADALAGQDRQTPGFLVRGGFGAGKSHLLTVFEHAALAEGFVVSRVVISKETPLHDPAKLLATAVEAMRCGGEVDRGLDPVARRLPDRREEPSLVALGRRLENAADLDDRFAATLTLYLHGFHDQALADRVVRFWAGDKLEVSLIRRALRDLEHPGSHLLQPIKKRDLALQSFAFIPRLVRAAGLPG